MDTDRGGSVTFMLAGELLGMPFFLPLPFIGPLIYSKYVIKYQGIYL